MEAVWYGVLAAMLAIYAVMDGFDLGAGIVHLFIARDARERGIVVRTIGPFWDGNEVWLIAAGGVLFCAFPLFYGAAFSGFYLALMLFLWLLIVRGVSLELRGSVAHALWQGFWAAAFGVSSLLLTFLLGAALGNIIRGVRLGEMVGGTTPLAPNHFFTPLWTDFLPGTHPGLLDAFTVFFGAIAVAALALHGAVWIVLKSEGPFTERVRAFASRAWVVLVVLVVASLPATWWVRGAPPSDSVLQSAAACGAGLLALAALASVPVLLARRTEGAAFAATSLFIAGMLAATAIASYPVLLHSTNPDHPDLTVSAAVAPARGLQAAARWWPFALVLAAGYFVFVHRIFRGKIAADEDIYGEH